MDITKDAGGSADLATMRRLAAAAAVTRDIREQIVRLMLADLAAPHEDALPTPENMERLRVRMLGGAWTVACEMRLR